MIKGCKIPLMMILATVLTLSSCGSGRRVAVRHGLPSGKSVKEISLDELLGSKGPVGPVVAPADLSDRAKAVVEAAHGWLGTPYKYGGDNHRGIDCSALVMNVYKEALGISLPRNSRKQREFASNVSRRDMLPGDLVFFSSTKGGSGITHVGLFIGSDRFIHASSSRGVVVSKLSEKYFMNHYHSAGRVADLTQKSRSRKTDYEPTRREIEAERQLELLDEILNATIDSIYSMPVDDDPNLAPGL